jgi:hypothetical protein
MIKKLLCELFFNGKRNERKIKRKFPVNELNIKKTSMEILRWCIQEDLKF